MAKKNQEIKVNEELKVKEAELFAIEPQENKIEEVKVVEENKAEEVKVETPEVKVEEIPEMEMELEIDGEEVNNEMEELVAEKVQKEERDNQEQKHKRGPKPQTEEEKAEKKENQKEEKKEKALNLNDVNIQQREIKKGRLSAPQGRIEKNENGYSLKLAQGIIFPQDAKATMTEFQTTQRMNDGKYIVTSMAAKNLGLDKFKAKHENGEEVEHQYVRVELHKPGREKDVVELFTVAQAKEFMKVQDAKDKKKEEEAKKKAEKEAKEKEEAKKELKEELKEA